MLETSSKATNLTMVYGIYLHHNGTIPAYKPSQPASAFISLKALLKEVVKVPSGLVYILTLIASHGHNKVSAINSAVPEAIDQPTFLYLFAFSSPTIPL